MLDRDALEKFPTEATGFRGMLNDIDGLDNIESDLALVKTCEGNPSPRSSSFGSSMKTGNDGNSFPGR